MIPPHLRTFLIAREAEARQTLTFGIISWQTSFTICQEADVSWWWQVSGVANVHSGLPFTPVLAFDNADIQSLLIPERPDLVGNP